MNFVWLFLPNLTYYQPQNHTEQEQVIASQERSMGHMGKPQIPVELKKLQNTTTHQEKLLLTREDIINAGFRPKAKLWSYEEDRLLLRLRNQEDLSWDEISKFITNRTGLMCYNRYKRLNIAPKRPWKPKDDAQLVKLVDEHGENWKKIGQIMQSKGACQSEWNQQEVRQRYRSYARADLNREEWSVDEDMILIELFNERGRDWEEAKRRLPQRSVPQIQYRLTEKLLKLNEKKLKEQTVSD